MDAPFATIGDLTAPGRFPRALTPEEAAGVPIMLEDASFLLRSKVPGLQDAVDSGDENITYAAMLLTVAMVKRALLAQAAQQTIVNPAISQMSESWGSYSQVLKLREDAGNLYLYASELEAILALVRGNLATAVSIRSPGF